MKKILSVVLSIMMLLSVTTGMTITAQAATGSEIVAYARQFIGYPYVYGTQGPNSFDCSGFVQYVFKHFGISLPASTRNYWNNPTNYGTVVGSGSTANAVAGDVISWSGHVAIYTENGKCVEALNSKYGVTESIPVNGHTNGTNYKVIRINGVYQKQTAAPSYAYISTDKLNYAVNETVTFSFNTDISSNTNTLWVYCPNGETLYYQNLGASTTLAFGMPGYYEGLVEAWNGVGSCKSSRISWYVGAPQYSNISISKSNIDINENVTFNFDTAASADCNTLWIYYPDGHSKYYQNCGKSKNLSFSSPGKYEALVEAWNGVGSCKSSRISWYVGAPQHSNIKISKSNININENVTFNFDTAASADCNTLWIYYPDGHSKYYQNCGKSKKLSFSSPGKYEALVEAWNGVGSCKSKRITFTVNCGHPSYTTKITKAATCKSTGTKTSTCTICGTTKTEIIPKKAHTILTDAAVPVTCTKNGLSEGAHCSKCGTIIIPQKTIPATGHSFDEGTVVKIPTYTETGIKEYKCSVCGEVLKSEVLAKIEKKTNTLKANGKTKTLMYSTLKKKNVTIACRNAINIKNAKGTVTYSKISGNKKLTVSKSGNITVKKGLKKGKYKLKIKVKASGNTKYKSANRTVTVTIKVK